MIKNFKLYEKMVTDEKILFIPSGELFDVNSDEIDNLSEYVILNYDEELDCYTIDDDYREMIILVLNYKK